MYILCLQNFSLGEEAFGADEKINRKYFKLGSNIFRKTTICYNFDEWISFHLWTFALRLNLLFYINYFSLSLRILSNGRYLNEFYNNNFNDSNDVEEDYENGDELELTTFLVHFTFWHPLHHLIIFTFSLSPQLYYFITT